MQNRPDPRNPKAWRDASISLSQRGYRLFAPIYDFVFGLSLQHGRRLAIAALDARPGDRILEVGVGSGMSLPMYPQGVSVIGIDISNEMLDKARQRVDRRKLSQTHTLLQMDVEHLDFAEASFDQAVVMYALAGFPDPVRAIAEVQRVCKPGATLVIVNHFLSRRPLSRLFDILLMPIYRIIRYRVDLDIDALLADADLELLERKPANLFGYSTVLVCRGRGASAPRPRRNPEPLELDAADTAVAHS